MNSNHIYLLSAKSDSPTAEALCSSMKRYRLPGGVVSGNGVDSHSIFLDTEETPLNSETVERLDNACYLILLFSPATGSSKSVMDKLFYFERISGCENIVPVIAEGEPADIFPDMFIQHRRVRHILPDLTVVEMDETVEPVAADLRGTTPRRRRDALRYETVRITASVLDIHPDTLEQRHRKRRNRTIAAVAGGAAAVFTAIAVLFTVLGIRTYREGVVAEKQAQMAEESVERLTKQLPEEFKAYPEAREAVDNAIARAETALSSLNQTGEEGEEG